MHRSLESAALGWERALWHYWEFGFLPVYSTKFSLWLPFQGHLVVMLNSVEEEGGGLTEKHRILLDLHPFAFLSGKEGWEYGLLFWVAIHSAKHQGLLSNEEDTR